MFTDVVPPLEYNQPGATLIKRMDSPSPSSYQLPITPQASVPLLHHAGILADLILRKSSADKPQLLSVQEAITVPYPEDTTSQQPRALAFVSFLLLLLWCSLSLAGWDTDDPFMSANSTNTFSLHFTQSQEWDTSPQIVRQGDPRDHPTVQAVDTLLIAYKNLMVTLWVETPNTYGEVKLALAWILPSVR